MSMLAWWDAVTAAGGAGGNNARSACDGRPAGCRRSSELVLMGGERQGGIGWMRAHGCRCVRQAMRWKPFGLRKAGDRAGSWYCWLAAEISEELRGVPPSKDAAGNKRGLACLLTRMSRPPTVSRSQAANSATDAASETSSLRKATARPRARSGAAAASPRAPSRAVSTTVSPCSARRAARACPMPRFAPVTTATVSLDHQALRAGIVMSSSLSSVAWRRRQPWRCSTRWTRERERERAVDVTRPEATPWCSSSPSSRGRGRRRGACRELGGGRPVGGRSEQRDGDIYTYTGPLGAGALRARRPEAPAATAAYRHRTWDSGARSARTLGHVDPQRPEHMSCTCPAPSRSYPHRPGFLVLPS
jgi:hypothetical protein